MSSRPLLALMALSSFFVVPGTAAQSASGESIPALLLLDEIDRAETLLAERPDSAEKSAFQGEIAFRRGDFERARTLYESALNQDGNVARAHFGLGKLALAKIRIQEATGFFDRAIELEPEEPLYRLFASEAAAMARNTAGRRAHLEEFVRLSPESAERLTEARAALEVLTAFDGIEIGAVEAPDSIPPIRLQKFLNLIFAQVMINGQGPFNFAVDTGATQTVVNERLAGELGLTPVTTTMMHGVGGSGRVESRIFRVDRLQIGEVNVSNLPVGTFNDPLVSQIADGILGTAILSDYIVTINYPASQMEVARSAAAQAEGDALPVWYFSNLLLAPIEVNGKMGNFVVDTGAVATVLSHSMAAALGVREDTPGAKVELAIAGVGGVQGTVLRVPDITMKTSFNSEIFEQVVAIDLKQISRMIGTEVSGVLGYDYLQNYKLTLDYYGSEVRLSR